MKNIVAGFALAGIALVTAIGSPAAMADVLTLTSPQGVFQLAENQAEWDVDKALHHSTSVKLREWF